MLVVVEIVLKDNFGFWLCKSDKSRYVTKISSLNNRGHSVQAY